MLERHLRGPAWEDVCRSVQTFAVSEHNGTYDFVVQSPGREFRFVRWYDDLGALSRTFEPLIAHAHEVWVQSTASLQHGQISFLHTFLPHALEATKVFLDISYPRAPNIFGDLLATEKRDNARLIFAPLFTHKPGHSRDIELRVRMNSTSPKAYRQVREFREFVGNYGAGDAARCHFGDIFLYAPECKESLKLRKRAEGGTRSEGANQRQYDTHPQLYVLTELESFPQVQLSAASTAPCPHHWDMYYR